MTPLGSREAWPQNLKIMVDLLIQLPTTGSEGTQRLGLQGKAGLG
jgi:hypothetical protein